MKENRFAISGNYYFGVTLRSRSLKTLICDNGIAKYRIEVISSVMRNGEGGERGETDRSEGTGKLLKLRPAAICKTCKGL